MVSTLSRSPSHYSCRVVFMRRRIPNILALHIKAIARRSGSSISEKEKNLVYKAE